MEETVKQKMIARKRWFIAAIFLGIIIVGGWLFQSKLKAKEDKELFAAYYRPYPSNLLMKREEHEDNVYTAIVTLYDKKDYKSAIELLEQRMIEIPDDIPSKMLLGNSYLGLEPFQAAKAIETFKSLAAQSTDNIYQETAQWYLALSYIRKGEDVGAKQLLETLAVKKYGKYPKLAEEVLKKL